jgi:tRNA pseudouridine38-40 synthase
MSGLRWNDASGGKKDKKRKRDGSDGGNESDDNSPSGGSIPIEEVKQSAEWARKVTFPKEVPKRKYAVCVSYLGTAYRGLQINPGILTVEAVLEKALFLAGGVEECNYGDFHKLSWSRAGRTDKGVHAVTNCCSMKLSVPLDQEAAFVLSVNTFLPADVRVLTMTKTMKNFSAKIYCSGRLYRYMLPTYVLSQLDTVAAVMDGVLSDADAGDTAPVAHYNRANKNTTIGTMTPLQLSLVRQALLGHRLSPAALLRFRDILQRFEGTHKFHNFTSDKNPSDDNAKRYILSCECGEPLLFPESPVEWVCISLRGQSFLLNQVGTVLLGYAVLCYAVLCYDMMC